MNSKVEEINRILTQMNIYLDIENLKNKAKNIQEHLQNSEWSPNSIKLEKELSSINKIVDQWDNYNNHLLLIQELEKEDSSISPLLEEIDILYEEILKYQIQSKFQDDDHKDCFLEIHSGAGGTEAQDWAHMLLLMYEKWALKENFSSKRIWIAEGEEAGIKGAIIQIQGDNVYGWLKRESGIHRLVRISPFNAQGKRQTSFASVNVYPVIDHETNVEINSADLRIDTYRSGGAGGQHVNTTDSAVRITHIPTGIVVQCQNERSQHQNKRVAMSILTSRIHELEKRKKEENQEQKIDIGWGNQIRSYVLHPYQMIKDLRTGYESSSTSEILRGEIKEILEYNIYNWNNSNKKQ